MTRRYRTLAETPIVYWEFGYLVFSVWPNRRWRVGRSKADIWCVDLGPFQIKWQR